MVNSRNKGASAERELANVLQLAVDAALPPSKAIKIKRNLEQYQEGGDDLMGLPFLAIEVKRCEKLQIGSWWQQCLDQAKGRIPVLAYRQNNKPWRVRMLLDCYGDVVVEVSIHDFLQVLRGMLRDPMYGGKL